MVCTEVPNQIQFVSLIGSRNDFIYTDCGFIYVIFERKNKFSAYFCEDIIADGVHRYYKPASDSLDTLNHILNRKSYFLL
jgi:diaminopimelate epimerase